MTYKYRILAHGFTLIELLVVISIIGILAGMVIVSFTSSQKQARDTARKSDLTQYRILLESFANKNNGLFPVYSSTTDASGNLCTSLGSSGTCPEDPKSLTNGTYKYQSDISATQYVLWAKLENITNMFWVTCSTGQSGKIASSTTMSGGNCPTGLTP